MSSCVAFGFFDGMHKGHLSIVKKVVEQSTTNRLTSKVVTFFANDMVHTTEREKEYYLKKNGIEEVISKEFVKTENIKDLLKSLNAKIIVVGSNFNFNGIDAEALKAIADEIDSNLIICDVEKENGEAISVTMLDEAMEKGDYEKYATLCTHPYTIVGKIGHGKKLGRTVGMPTANLDFESIKKMPQSGVYSTISHFGEEKFMGMTNIGKRPSVDDEERITVETFIIDFSQDVYEKECVLEVFFPIRGVIKFNSLQEVQEQVQKDVQASREKLSEFFV